MKLHCVPILKIMMKTKCGSIHGWAIMEWWKVDEDQDWFYNLLNVESFMFRWNIWDNLLILWIVLYSLVNNKKKLTIKNSSASASHKNITEVHWRNILQVEKKTNQEYLSIRAPVQEASVCRAYSHGNKIEHRAESNWDLRDGWRKEERRKQHVTAV